MKKTCRILLVILVLMLVSQNFLACKKNDIDVDHNTSESISDNDTTTGIRPPLDIPNVTFSGTEFTVLLPKNLDYDFVADQVTGNNVNDAVYKRNLNIEQRFDIKFKFIQEDGVWSSRTAYNNLIKASVSAQDGTYDLVSGIISCVIPTTSEGIFLDVSDLEYVNLDNPWWVSNLFDELNIEGKLFAMSGDGLLSFYKELNVIYCNLNLLERYYNDVNIYDIVRDGEWTFDKMCELAIPVRMNNDGDDNMDPAVDTFGFTSINVPNRSWATAFDITVISKDADGKLSITKSFEKFLNMYDKLYNAFSKNDNFHVDPSAKPDPNVYFSEGKSLFLLSYLNASETIKEMEEDYCILPMPKFDDLQSNYHTQVGTSSAMLFVPTDVRSSDLSSAICESLSYYNHFDVVPEYYDEALKVKYARNENVAEMLNIIRESASLKFQYAYSSEFSPMIFTILEMSQAKMDKYAEVISSYLETNKVLWKSKLDVISTAYAKLN